MNTKLNREALRHIARLEAAHLEAALAEHPYATNDIVRIGLTAPPMVSSRALTKVSAHGWAFFYVLAVGAIEAPGAYIPTSSILSRIVAIDPLLSKLGKSWLNPTEDQVYSAVLNIRQTLKQKKLNHDLVQRFKQHGYRLSTPALNIIIDVPRILAGSSPSPFIAGGRV